MNARQISFSALVLLVGAGAVACAKNEDIKPWTCESGELPAGEVVRCTQNALLVDSTIPMDETCTGYNDNPELCNVYTCTAGEANCPPATTTTTDTSGGSTGTATSTAPTGGGDTSTTTGTPTDTSATGDSAPGNSGNGNGNGKGGNGNGPNSSDMGGSSSGGNGNAYGNNNPKSNAGGNGHGPFSSDMGGKTQCGYVPDLPYCSSGTATGSPGSSSGGPAGSSGGGPGGSSGGGPGSTSGGSPSGGVCAPSAGGSSDGSDSAGATSESPGIAATGILCADHPFGSPESECGHFGLTPSGKDDNVGGTSCSATQSASVAIVKSGTKGCDKGQAAYRVYTGVTKGDTLNTPAGQGISHVTYCSGTPSTTTDSTGAAAPAPASPPPADSCTSTTVKPQYKCSEDKKTHKRHCESLPACAPGTHMGACGACIDDGSTADCVPPEEGGCWVTGGGFIVAPNDVTGAAADGHDSFGGNAKPMKDGHVQGHWNHVDHGTKNHAKGKPEYIVCRHVDEPGPGQPGGKKGFDKNQVYFGGHAEWREHDLGDWQSGYWFDVVAKDHGEPGSVPNVKNGFMPDTYHFTIRKMEDPAGKVSGAVVYETHGTLQGGNIQIHPPNPGHPSTPMSLPSFVSFEP